MLNADFGKSVGGVKDCRKIHKEHCENAPEILHIPKENEKRREDKPCAEVEYDKTDNRNYEREKERCYGNAVQNAE